MTSNEISYQGRGVRIRYSYLKSWTKKHKRRNGKFMKDRVNRDGIWKLLIMYDMVRKLLNGI